MVSDNQTKPNSNSTRPSRARIDALSDGLIDAEIMADIAPGRLRELVFQNPPAVLASLWPDDDGRKLDDTTESRRGEG